jgi:hypothetical protein
LSLPDDNLIEPRACPPKPEGRRRKGHKITAPGVIH